MYPRLVAGGFRGASDKEAWEAVQQHNELILNAAGEGIYGVDCDGRTIFVNPAAAEMTGHRIDELLGKSMHEIVHHSHPNGDHYHAESCPIYAAFNDGMVRNVGDEVFWRKDGSSFRVEYTSTPITNDGKLLGAVVVFRDITLRCQTEERLRAALSELRALKEQLQQENRYLRKEISTVRGLAEIVGKSSVLRETQRIISKVAPLESTVLILGETGVGKELVARALHELNPNRSGPMIRVNCGALSPQLVDSELFGHEQGAFTGATKRRSGRFELAQSGTLFLDEVGELPLETQARLLRVLQEREFERVGGTSTITTDARVIAATNRDLEECVREGTFRQDLYYRLNVMAIYVPPLRDRAEDVPELAQSFLRQLEVRYGRRLGRFSNTALATLQGYSWPGNVRELQNLVERVAMLSDGATLEVPSELLRESAEPNVEPNDTPEPRVESQPPRSQSLEQVERDHILAVLQQAHWRLSGPRGAAEVLGMHPNTLRHRMKKLGIQR